MAQRPDSLFCLAVQPGHIHRAVFANRHAGKVVFCWVLLHGIDCSLLPGSAAIAGVRDHELILAARCDHMTPETYTLLTQGLPGLVSTVSEVSNGEGVARVTQGDDRFAPVGAVG